MTLKQEIICVWILAIHHSKPKLPYMVVTIVEEINYGFMTMYDFFYEIMNYLFKILKYFREK